MGEVLDKVCCSDNHDGNTSNKSYLNSSYCPTDYPQNQIPSSEIKFNSITKKEPFVTSL